MSYMCGPERTGDPYGTRTRVSAVKGRRPRPLDEGAKISARALGIRHDKVNQGQIVLFSRQLHLKLLFFLFPDASYP